MYTTGELEEVMEQFEKSMKTSVVFVSGSMEREEKAEIETDDGRIQKRYKNQHYYQNHTINQYFIIFFHGYAFGKTQ
jgi:hypothetical protein